MTQARQAPGADLHEALEAAMADRFGAARRIARIARRPSAYGSSHRLEELDVDLADGTRLPLILKDLGREGQLADASRVRPDFVHDPLREIEVYGAMLDAAGLGTAAFYGSSVDAERGRYWLFVERIVGAPLVEVGDFAVWRAAARWLARLHARTPEGCAAVRGAKHLLRYDGDYCRRWLLRALTFLRDAAPEPARRRFEWLAGRYDGVVDRLRALPASLLHGEFYAANVLVAPAAGGVRVCPVDWEMAAVGPGLLDLAALTSGKWTAGERRELADAYRGACGADGASDRAALVPAAWECCRLQAVVQWLGWARSWSPPRGQAHDWLGDALGLIDALEGEL